MLNPQQQNNKKKKNIMLQGIGVLYVYVVINFQFNGDPAFISDTCTENVIRIVHQCISILYLYTFR